MIGPICTFEPTASVRLPHCVFHAASLRTVTAAPLGGSSSAAVKYRPICGFASKKPKKLALTLATFISRAASPTPTATS